MMMSLKIMLSGMLGAVLLAGLAHADFPNAPLETCKKLQQQIDQAIATGQSQLVIQPGIYRIAPPTSGSKPHLIIRDAKNLHIVAKDVQLLCTTLNRALDIEGCEGLILEGVSIDYDPLPFTQATVIALSADHKTIDMKIHDGYPPVGDRVRISVIDPNTRRIKTGTWTRYSGTFSTLANGLIRLSQPRPIVDTLAVGDYLVLSRKTLSPHAVMLTRCRKTTLKQVTLNTSTSFGFLELAGDANHYDNLIITPGSIPAEASEPRLLSTLADGFHSKHSRKGPLVENCRFDHMGDDGIAINGDFILVLDSDANVKHPTVTMAFKRKPYVQVGDRIMGLKSDTGVPIGVATVRAMVPVKFDAQALTELKKQVLPDLRHAKYLFNKEVYQLTLDKPLSVNRGDIASCPDRNGSGFVVRNNTITDNRARGILVKASDGIIENNTVANCSMSGIVLGPEIDYWMEADFSRNVIIRGNTIRAVNHGVSNPGNIFAGAISIVGSGIMPAGGQRDITIQNNAIEQTTGLAMLITSAMDVIITNNKIHQPHLYAGGQGANLHIPSSAVIYVTESQKVMLKGNTVSSPGKHMGKMLQTGDNTQVFSNDGLRLIEH
ncbi:MAG TPA: hypothetical protein DCM28_04140 [Phycisphaerales bacterium]|nr:hypothetical protein [Phycisphaerales bacterium]HCD34192.1 hypothetical protein [Phycisphaerales bacterium]|tara:strand:- start:170341 stop:172155 length:1815 start_codon:yes stop_codon:yes gene_type:complete